MDKFICVAVSMETSAVPTGTSGDGVSLLSCPSKGERAEPLCHHVHQYWTWAVLGRSMTWAALPATGRSPSFMEGSCGTSQPPSHHHVLFLQNTFPCTGHWGFPGGSVVKESTCQCRRCRFDLWVGKIPWRRKWQPTPVFLLGESHGQRSLAGYSPWGHKESEMTE